MSPLDTSLLPAPAAVDLDLESQTIRGAMRKLHDALERHPAIREHAALWRAFEERLALGANCLSAAVAIPHVRTSTVSEMVLAVGRSRLGVEVDESHPSVRIVFLVAAPPNQINEYLAFMAALSRRLKTPGTLDGLLRATSEAEFRGVLAGSG